MIKILLGSAAATAMFALVPTAASAQCVGNCGTLGADGVVTASPIGGTYSYVTTSGGATGVGLGIGSETNGSTFTTGAFTAEAGDELEFFFNYITSDGSGFADYAWAELLGPAGGILFTARTTPTGDTVPGFGLPGLLPGVTLLPASTPINGIAPIWSPLGGSSGACFQGVGQGCGFTDWIAMNYTVAVAGSYRLRFGVVNWTDTSFDSGFAWDGAVIDGNPIPAIPEPATWGMMIAGFGLIGAAARRRRTVALAA